jgi:GT2 family glycosyltransferase
MMAEPLPFEDDPAGVAAWLVALAEQSGRGIYRRAATALLGRRAPGGRPAICDDDQLAECTWLIENGRARSNARAAMMVAATAGPNQNIDAIAARLRRKLRPIRKYEQN